MADKKRGLGRGLEALLGQAQARAPSLAGESGDKPARPGGDELARLPVDLLERGKYQPRLDMREESLAELADSIRAQGVVQPIVVRPLAPPPAGGSQRYEIIAGERRWRAAQMAGLADVPAVIRRVPDEAAVAMSLIENIQRENLNPVEEANALQRLIDEFRMTHQAVAEAVGRSRAAVTNLLRLLTLNADVREMLEKGKMDMGHARALLALDGAQQSKTARQVVERGLSVRETEQLVRRLTEKPAPRKRSGVDPDVRALTQKLSDKLGAKVRIQAGRRGRGKLVIEYTSLDQLDGILARIR